MSAASKYDVIIAGAGPAGSTAGYILGKSGLRVLLVDKSTFPRNKVCGGLITHKTTRLLERVFGLTVTSLGEKGILDYESGSYEVRTRNSVIVRGMYRIPFRFIDRYRYDHFLLSEAREAGAEVVEGDRIASIDVLRSEVTTASGRRFASRAIIGADGVNSRIRRSFPSDLFGRENWSGNLASAHEIVIKRHDLGLRVDQPVLYYDYIDFGYAWIFPNRENLIFGMCGLKRKNAKSIVSAFREFLSASGVNPDQDHKISSYVLPYGNFLPEPVFRNILLAGDAAGLADPLLGEGIFYAQRSAELAARAITRSLEKDGFHAALKNNYQGLLREHIFPELIYAGKMRDTLFKLLRKFRWLPLKVLMNVCGDMPVETIHGLRSYRWMRRRTDY
jgi:geranylgeranyl reductase family protein